MSEKLYGYTGKVLRINLTDGGTITEKIEAEMLKRYVGGTGLGTKYLYEEVPPGVEWDSADNRLIISSGPLGATRVSGSGTFSVVTKGPMTNLAVATQANGFFGAFLKFAGFDGIILQGIADRLVYLYIHDGRAEIRDASHLAGKDTWETEDAIRKELGGGRRLSIFGIGPAGENLARFAAIVGDKGHVAAHNGVGAVMGKKNLKAIAVERGDNRPEIKDSESLSELSRQLFEASKNHRGGTLYKWGTAGGLSGAALGGWLPIKNYTTSVFEEHEKINGQYMRTHFEHKPNPCWACRMRHCYMMRVTEGPYAGFEGEEPEYECAAAWGSLIGNTDAGAVVMLTNLTDRLGLDVNESGWVMAWVMECYEKGLLTKDDTDGLEMTWGNVEAVRSMLHKIAARDGFGDLLAEGVKRASEEIGGEAVNMGIYTLKGASPRGHDHRGRWSELLDTCVTNTSTIEATFGGVNPEALGMQPVSDAFSPQEVSTVNAKVNGWRQFEDCLGTCRFCTVDPTLTIDCVNSATGWELTLEDAMRIGRRIVNQLRVFNFRHGLTTDLEKPSPRYGSTPVDGPARGKSIMSEWKTMVSNYYHWMGWDRDTGKPLPETLKQLELESLIQDMKE
ncbi:MAG: aldehyde ferredoxin oxidoreductase family protein [Candidatus Poribacteria bacterium]